MSIDYTRGVVGRDPLGKTLTGRFIAAYPDESDEQIADRINRQLTEPAIDAAEVAHWRKEMQ